MSDKAPAFRWSNARLGGPRATSKLAFGPLCPDDLKKMGLVNGVCPAMGSMYCFSQCDEHPHENCPVVEDSATLAGDETNCGTPCQSCTLLCPCKVQFTRATNDVATTMVMVDLAAQEARMLKHRHWWGEHCITVRKQP